MAMEKLILRSVLYGVDKIPDSWFDKVPGGFYKSNEKKGDKGEKDPKIDDRSDGKKQRRYSHHGDESRRTRRDRYEDERRAEDRRRQDRRERSSYDGSHDQDHPRDDRHRRHRRHSVDSDRYGHNDGYTSSSNAYYGSRKYRGAERPRPIDPYFDDRQRPVTSESSRSAMPPSSKAVTGASSGLAGVATAEAGTAQVPSKQRPNHTATMPPPISTQSQSTSSARPQSSGSGSSYVPYAHIYGSPGSGPSPTFAPPPRSGTFPQSQSTPVAGPQSYQQNPFAQEALMTTNAGAPMHAPQPTMPTRARAFAGYENEPPYPESPRFSRSTDRYSPSYASHDKRDADVPRSRSEHRPDSSDKRSRYYTKPEYVDPQAPLPGHVKMPSPPNAPPPTRGKDDRRDSAHERESRHDRRRANDRGYTSD